MFGIAQQEHDERYAFAEEWTEVLKRMWTTKGESDYEGRYFEVKAGFSEPKPLQKPYPVLMNAGTSPAGRAFASRHSDVIFAPLQRKDTARQQITDLKALTDEEPDRQIKVFGRAHIVCREQESEAWEHWRHVHRERADVEAIANYMTTNMKNSQSNVFENEETARIAESLAAGRGSLPLVGTPDQIVEGMLELSECGLDGLVLSWVDYDEGLAQLGEQILPRMIDAGLRANVSGLSTAVTV